MTFKSKWLGVAVAVLMFAVWAPLAVAQVTPSVTVSDQPIENEMVTVDQVVSVGAGWIVIHADANGAPGPVLGNAAVSDGENLAVQVQLAAEGRTEMLWAMLHTDAGTVGTYEFPGDDGPVTVDGSVVVVPFNATGGMMEEAPVEEATPAPEAQTLPETGGVLTPWTSIALLAAGALIVLLGLGLALARR